jgi:hypothetical protein
MLSRSAALDVPSLSAHQALHNLLILNNLNFPNTVVRGTYRFRTSAKGFDR